MSSFLLVALAIAATPNADRAAGSHYTSSSAIERSGDAVAANRSESSILGGGADASVVKDSRSPAAWRSDIRTELRRESSTKGVEREAAVRQLLTLYQQLGRPTNLVESEQRQLRAQIRSRLKRTSESLAIQARRRGTPNTLIAQESSAGVLVSQAISPPVHIDLPDGVLAQQIGLPGAVIFPPGQQGAANPFGQPASGSLLPLANVALLGPDQSAALADLIRTVIAPDKWDLNGGGAILAQQVGPPAQAAGFGAQNAAGAAQRQNADAGLELVELIQQTIAPDSWDVNGGPGTIMYFSPLRVLVVRQTDEVHDALGGLIPALRN